MAGFVDQHARAEVARQRLHRITRVGARRVRPDTKTPSAPLPDIKEANDFGNENTTTLTSVGWVTTPPPKSTVVWNLTLDAGLPAAVTPGTKAGG